MQIDAAASDNKMERQLTTFMCFIFFRKLAMFGFYPRDAMLARVIEIATCLSVRPSVCPSRAGIVSKQRKLAA